MTAPLGPFRLTARILSSPAGIVYAALDPAGRPVQVALLTKGAASDPAARDRFAAAVRSSKAGVLAADTGDQGPWVIGAGEGDLAGLLEPVLLRGEARGPQFLHHWIGREDPAFPTGRPAEGGAKKAEYPTFTGSPAPGGWSTDGALSSAASRVLVVLALIALVLLLVAVVVLLVWLLRSQPEPLPVEPEPTVTTGPASPSPSPSPSGSGSQGPPTPDPSGTTPMPSGPGSGPSTGPTGWPDDGDNPL